MRTLGELLAVHGMIDLLGMSMVGASMAAGCGAACAAGRPAIGASGVRRYAYGLLCLGLAGQLAISASQGPAHSTVSILRGVALLICVAVALRQTGVLRPGDWQLFAALGVGIPPTLVVGKGFLDVFPPVAGSEWTRVAWAFTLNTVIVLFLWTAIPEARRRCRAARWPAREALGRLAVSLVVLAGVGAAAFVLVSIAGWRQRSMLTGILALAIHELLGRRLGLRTRAMVSLPWVVVGAWLWWAGLGAGYPGAIAVAGTLWAIGHLGSAMFASGPTHADARGAPRTLAIEEGTAAIPLMLAAAATVILGGSFLERLLFLSFRVVVFAREVLGV